MSCGKIIDHTPNVAMERNESHIRHTIRHFSLSNKNKALLLFLTVIGPMVLLGYVVSVSFYRHHRVDIILIGAGAFALLASIGLVEWRATGPSFRFRRRLK